MTETPQQPQPDQSQHVGRPTILETFLKKNPELKARYETARKKAEAPEQYNESDIASLDDLWEYLVVEMTRSKNEDVLRGKTFADYSKIFIDLYKLKIDAEKVIAETDAKCKKILNDRTEAEVFMKIIYEAITDTIKDIPTRKDLSDKIQILYDKYYPTDTNAVQKEPDEGSNV